MDFLNLNLARLKIAIEGSELTDIVSIKFNVLFYDHSCVNTNFSIDLILGVSSPPLHTSLLCNVFYIQYKTLKK